MDLMGALMKGGLLSNRPIAVGDETASSIELISRALWESPASKENPVWAYGLVVQVTGERNGRKTVCTYRNHHPPQEEWGGPSAYFKNVGIPLSIGAQLIAAGEGLAEGVVSAELALPTERFFQELARRGITVEETIVEEGRL